MKKLITALSFLVFFDACTTKDHPVTDIVFIDSLINHYSLSPIQKLNQQDSVFWKDRLDKAPVGFVERQQYAGILSGRFHLYGDIKDIRTADSIMKWINLQYKEEDAGPIRTLAGYAILQHKFNEASDDVQKAIAIGSDMYASLLLNFDVAFEMGRMMQVKEMLKQIKSSNEYGYFFRLSKYEHLLGELDSSINAMATAAELAGTSKGLKQVAISNEADLYMHAADVKNANQLYMQSIRIDASDLHSIMGMGWIALVHDKNDSLAEKIFRFVQTKTQSPEILLKMAQVEEQRGDSIAEKKYVDQFISIVSDSVYGNMYNKYVIDLYTGFLHEPSKAVTVAEREMTNRMTPQTYSWYVWSLYKNGQKDKALELYDKNVSGKPLEGLELYYMGLMMKEMNKGYNAEQYFKAAYKNRYDLSPAKQKNLEDLMKN